MPHLPFNRNFWLVLAATMFAGGLLFGRAAGLNDALNVASATLGTQGRFLQERTAMRQIDAELIQLDIPPSDEDFGEVDAALREL
jgi:hypothetical protein